MKNRLKRALAYLCVMALVVGFIPATNIAVIGTMAASADASKDATSGEASSDASGDTSEDNTSGDASGDGSKDDVSGNASGDASADVYVTIADKGDLAVGKDEDKTLMAQVPIHVTDVDEDGTLTFNDAMMITHDKYCKDGYSSGMTNYGLSVFKLWNDESGNYGYYVDNKSAWSAAESIKEGSQIVAYINKGTYASGNLDNYTYFTRRECSVKASENVSLALMMLGYDDAYNTIIIPYEAATLGTVAVSSGNAEFTSLDKVTDASGNAVISFAKPGIYVVSAKADASADAALVPPVCIVKVDANLEQGGTTEAPEPVDTTAAPTDTTAVPTGTTATPAGTTEASLKHEEYGPDTKAIALQKTKQKLSSVKSKKAKQATVTFKKNKKATGYQVQYSTSKKFKKKTTKTVFTTKTTYTIKKLKRKKTYFIRVRSVRKVNGKNYYGKYSVAKRVTIK